MLTIVLGGLLYQRQLHKLYLYQEISFNDFAVKAEELFLYPVQPCKAVSCGILLNAGSTSDAPTKLAYRSEGRT